MDKIDIKPRPKAAPVKAAAATSDRLEKEVSSVQTAAALVVQATSATPIPYGLDIAEIRRMARQLMTFEQIAAVFRIPAKVLDDCALRFPEIRQAYEEGAASAIDTATRKLSEAVEAGDLVAVKFTLERKGGWAPPPRDPPVIVLGATAGMTIDGSHVADMAERQRALRDIPDAELA